MLVILIRAGLSQLEEVANRSLCNRHLDDSRDDYRSAENLNNQGGPLEHAPNDFNDLATQHGSSTFSWNGPGPALTPFSIICKMLDYPTDALAAVSTLVATRRPWRKSATRMCVLTKITHVGKTSAIQAKSVIVSNITRPTAKPTNAIQRGRKLSGRPIEEVMKMKTAAILIREEFMIA